ncbi:tripartite tricarboxylate transporter permease [Aquibium sp. A9E412]|uniref:tripartite tricarboxylate transporter permease n=1 Tax=Aquibium sp. A9E412 TaxID=2976767 RepID=UPI0025B0CD9A|nr:tripartite tricarboxylate transporter permease [Aquibium sp. A9E412]MDN2567909.1 tripartite tricarboxylate transporter permease [Aquibium sp. A9E412]
MAVIYDAFVALMVPNVLVVIVLASVFGLFVGAVPGLTATMAVALLVPVTFFMEPLPAIAAIVSASAMAIFAGDIPATLLRIPGTPSSAAYTDAAYRMTKQGKAELVLGAFVVTSATGGLIGAIFLMFFAPVVARFALNISSYEYFWLACLGLTSAAFISPGSPVKGAISLLLGVLTAMVGVFPVTGQPRFTFGSTTLYGGVGLVAALIGMFAIAEILRFALSTEPAPKAVKTKIGNIFKGLVPEIWRFRRRFADGIAVGTGTGVLPGAGADIAAWISFAIARRFTRNREEFDKGSLEGIVAAGGANNASVSSAYVPATVLGIPGDSMTAIVIGVLFMKGLTPGPAIFQHQPTLIYGIFLSFILANLLMIPLGYAAIKLARYILDVPRQYLMPVIMMFCVVGAFAMDNTLIGVVTMLVFGIIGWFMEENGFPIAPALLGIILGRMVEETFLTSMIKAQGDFLQFFTRPIAGTVGAITILIWLSPLLMMAWRRLGRRRELAARGAGREV